MDESPNFPTKNVLNSDMITELKDSSFQFKCFNRILQEENRIRKKKMRKFFFSNEN